MKSTNSIVCGISYFEKVPHFMEKNDPTAIMKEMPIHTNKQL